MDKHIHQLFAKSLVIDGLMSYYMLEDPDCRDSDYSHYPIKDFGQIKALTGIDCGTVTVSNTIDLLAERYNYVSENSSARVIEKGSDIEKAWVEGRFSAIFYSQKH